MARVTLSRMKHSSIVSAKPKSIAMAPTRNGVHVQGADFLSVLQGRATLESLDHLKPNVAQMLDELQWWTRALKTARGKLRRSVGDDWDAPPIVFTRSSA